MQKSAGIKKVLSGREIKARLSPLFHDEELRLVLLFGSSVSGKIHKRSDIDLAFLFEGPVDIIKLTNRVINLLHTDNIDVVDLRYASPLLKYSAVKYGRVIYESSPGEFNEFYSLALKIYVDTKKLRDAQVKVIRNFLKERGLG